MASQTTSLMIVCPAFYPGAQRASNAEKVSIWWRHHEINKEEKWIKKNKEEGMDWSGELITRSRERYLLVWSLFTKLRSNARNEHQNNTSESSYTIRRDNYVHNIMNP